MVTTGLEGQRMSVMLVEDNPEDVFFTKRVLKQSGIEQITVVGDGQAALVTLEEMAADGRLPNLVLLDINLPVMGGIEMLKVIRADESLRQLPVIVLTTDETKKGEALECGANGFLMKPVREKDVVAKMSQLAL